MKIYLVGGAVRDGLLGIPFTERDWVVTGATVQDMLKAGFRYKDADAAFPVFLHPDTDEEYALARRETKTGAGYRGFDINTGPDITLEEDLARRDLTINAMAQDVDGNLIDPFKGQDDLDAGLLRHVTPAFAEDPVRLLRIARFAAKLGQYGFHVAHGTHGLLKRMSTDAELAALKPERIWQEMRRALAETQPWRFVEVLQRCGALSELIPELAATLRDDAGHGNTQSAAAIAALQCATAADLSSRWRLACLLNGISADVDALVTRLRIDREHAQAVRVLRKQLPDYIGLAAAGTDRWLAFLEQGRALQQPAAFAELLAACGCAAPIAPADLPARLESARAAAAGVEAAAVQAPGVTGAALGRALRQARLDAVARVVAGA